MPKFEVNSQCVCLGFVGLSPKTLVLEQLLRAGVGREAQTRAGGAPHGPAVRTPPAGAGGLPEEATLGLTGAWAEGLARGAPR